MKHGHVLKLSYMTTKHRIITSYLDFRHVKIFCCHFLSHVVLQNKQEVACASNSFPVYRSECICLCVILCTILNKPSSKNIFQILQIIKSWFNFFSITLKKIIQNKTFSYNLFISGWSGASYFVWNTKHEIYVSYRRPETMDALDFQSFKIEFEISKIISCMKKIAHLNSLDSICPWSTSLTRETNMDKLVHEKEQVSIISSLYNIFWHCQKFLRLPSFIEWILASLILEIEFRF